MKSSPFLIGAAILATDCGFMKPAKDPDSLTVQVPLEEAPPAKQSVNAGQDGGTAENAAQKPVEIRIMDSTREEICARLESGNSEDPCGEEIFRNASASSPDSNQFQTIRNRCLALMAECQKSSSDHEK